MQGRKPGQKSGGVDLDPKSSKGASKNYTDVSQND